MLCSTLGGTLERHSDGWRWRDGTPEPRVQDLNPNGVYNFRCTKAGGGQTYVEVPVGRAHDDDDLAWCKVYRRGPDVDAGLARNARAGSDDHRVGGRGAYFVPIEDWDAHWSLVGPIGASWLAEHEADILGRARALGWRPE